MMQRSRKRDSTQGFTLVEMLVVLAILVLVVSMVVPRVIGSQKKADMRTAKIQIGRIRSALEGYAADVKQFPTTEQGLTALVERPSDLEESRQWEGPYFDADLPKDPWGHEFQYQYPPTHTRGDSPEIWSMGPDGEDNTEDDICSWTGGSEGNSSETATATRDKSGSGPVRSTSNRGYRQEQRQHFQEQRDEPEPFHKWQEEPHLHPQ